MIEYELINFKTGATDWIMTAHPDPIEKYCSQRGLNSADWMVIKWYYDED